MQSSLQRREQEQAMKCSEIIEEFLSVAKIGGSLDEPKTGKVVTIENPLSPATLKYYAKIYNDFISTVGDMPLKRITIRHCSMFYNSPQYGKASSKRTLLNVMNRLFKLQVKLGRLSVNPWQLLKDNMETGGRAEQEDTYYLSLTDLKNLVDYFMSHGGDRMAIGVGIQGCTGTRMEEVIGNEWNVGKEEGAVHGMSIEDGKQLLQIGRLTLKGKGRKYREVIFMSAFLGDTYPLYIEVAEAYIYRREERMAVDDTDNRLVNINGASYNEHIKTAQIMLNIKPMSKVIQKPVDRKITSHVLRHTFGVQYINHGGIMEELKELMGHANIKTTQRYGKMDRETVQDRAMKINRLLIEKKE